MTTVLISRTGMTCRYSIGVGVKGGVIIALDVIIES